MSGFITMHRDALDHPLLKDGERFRAWFWLIAKACWKETRTEVAGHIVTLQRGQLCYSIRYLAEAWGWPKSNVDRFLKRLEAESMVSLTRSQTGTGGGTATGTGQWVITIRNYALYQDEPEESGTPEKPKVGQEWDRSGTAAGQIRTRETRETIEQGSVEANASTVANATQTGSAQGGLFEDAPPSGEDAPPPVEPADEPPAKPAAPTAADIKKAVFDTAKTMLSEAGIRDPGAIVVKWRRSYHDAIMLDVLTRAQAEQPEDPVSWITAALQNAKRRTSGEARELIPQPDRRDGAVKHLHGRLDIGQDQGPAQSARRWDDAGAGGTPALPYAGARAVR